MNSYGWGYEQVLQLKQVTVAKHFRHVGRMFYRAEYCLLSKSERAKAIRADIWQANKRVNVVRQATHSTSMGVARHGVMGLITPLKRIWGLAIDDLRFSVRLIIGISHAALLRVVNIRQPQQMDIILKYNLNTIRAHDVRNSSTTFAVLYALADIVFVVVVLWPIFTGF